MKKEHCGCEYWTRLNMKEKGEITETEFGDKEERYFNLT